MEFKRIIALLFILSSVLFTSTASSALIDRGAGLIYDTVLDVTWLQDANYAKTSGYDADGKMTWEAAKTWASNLSYYDPLRQTSWTDWRLPTVSPLNGHTFNYSASSVHGVRDYGFKITSSKSELSHLYYVSLGNHAYFERKPGPDIENAGPFKNLQKYVYWSGNTALGWKTNGELTEDLFAITFNTGLASLWGLQAVSAKSNELFAWAVMDGDVGPAISSVPLPASALLMISGLSLLVGFRRSRA